MRQKYLAGMALLSLNAILFCAMGAVNNSSVSLGSANINDSGFRPDVDGFSFQNYGEHPDTVDLTAAEMQRMFGGKVCASLAGGKCTLTYPAERWMNQAISAMKSGHCEGIAVLSSLMYYNQTSPSHFEGNAAIDLSLQNALLQREIGYWWTTQVTSPGGSKKVLESPQAVLDTLVSAFAEGQEAGEWWVMGIYLPDGSGGHAITPFAVEESGNGTARIYVYDNNWPMDSRFVEVDRANNTWRYLASSSPDEPDSLYSGNASTRNLEIVSLSSRLGIQQCDFCRDEDAAAGNASRKNMQIWQSGKACALVTDESGRRVGVLESGQLVNEIPGAEIRNLKFSLPGPGSSYPPVILLPLSLIKDSRLAIEINSTANGSGKNQADTAIIAPGFALSSSVPDLRAGQRQSLDLFAEGLAYNVSLRSSGLLSPTITIDSDYRRITLSGLNLDPSGMINLSMNPELGDLQLSTLGILKPGTLQLLLTTLDPASGEPSTFKSLDLMLRPDDGVSLDLGPSGGASMPSLAVSRKNGGRQEMTLQSVHRDVPRELIREKVTIPDNDNLTSSRLSGSVPASSGRRSVPRSTAMPSMRTPTFP